MTHEYFVVVSALPFDRVVLFSLLICCVLDIFMVSLGSDMLPPARSGLCRNKVTRLHHCLSSLSWAERQTVERISWIHTKFIIAAASAGLCWAVGVIIWAWKHSCCETIRKLCFYSLICCSAPLPLFSHSVARSTTVAHWALPTSTRVFSKRSLFYVFWPFIHKECSFRPNTEKNGSFEKLKVNHSEDIQKLCSFDM